MMRDLIISWPLAIGHLPIVPLMDQRHRLTHEIYGNTRALGDRNDRVRLYDDGWIMARWLDGNLVFQLFLYAVVRYSYHEVIGRMG